MNHEIVSKNALFTMSLGEKFSHLISKGSTICFTGDLGAGKTTFIRGIAKGLNIKETVQSPTFNIMKIYLKGDCPLIHIDAYRLEDINQDIGLDEYIGYETGITVIEWPQFIEKLLPKNYIKIDIKNLGDDKRRISFLGIENDIWEKIK